MYRYRVGPGNVYKCEENLCSSKTTGKYRISPEKVIEYISLYKSPEETDAIKSITGTIRSNLFTKMYLSNGAVVVPRPSFTTARDNSELSITIYIKADTRFGIVISCPHSYGKKETFFKERIDA